VTRFVINGSKIRRRATVYRVLAEQTDDGDLPPIAFTSKG
jgi:hypothetical protein